MTDAAAGVTAAIAAGNAAYEERFGRVFLIRAAGRSPEQILAELRAAAAQRRRDRGRARRSASSPRSRSCGCGLP